jgi:hypothetical protein
VSQRTIITTFCFVSLVLPLQAEEPKYKPIDADTIAVYEKLGAEYGGFKANEWGDIRFRPGAEAAANGLPGFRFGVLEGNLPKLPAVKISFGLDLTLTEVGDEGLKQLKNLDNLVLLHIRGTIVRQTKVDLEQLKKNLEILKSLRRGDRELTVAERQQMMAAFNAIELNLLIEDRNSSSKNSTLIYLYGTKVTDAGLEELKNLKTLSELDLRGTAVTDEGVKKLQKALPKCQILHWVLPGLQWVKSSDLLSSHRFESCGELVFFRG